MTPTFTHSQDLGFALVNSIKYEVSSNLTASDTAENFRLMHILALLAIDKDNFVGLLEKFDKFETQDYMLCFEVKNGSEFSITLGRIQELITKQIGAVNEVSGTVADVSSAKFTALSVPTNLAEFQAAMAGLRNQGLDQVPNPSVPRITKSMVDLFISKIDLLGASVWDITP